MVEYLSNLTGGMKLALASIFGAGAILAELPNEIKTWEDVSVKMLLLATVFFTVRQYLQSEIDHKKELKETWDLHKKDVEAREKLLVDALSANTEGLAVLTGLTKEQTDYYKAVTRNILDEKLKGKPTPTIP